MFGLRPTNLEVGYTASSALPAVLGKMVARWHKNRAVPKSACEKTDSGTKTELSHGETAETGGWLRAIMLSDGKPPGRRISQAPKPGLTSTPRSFCGTARFLCWDSPLRVYFSGRTPPPQRASLQRDESHYFRPNHVWRDLSRRRGEGEVPERGMGAWC